MIPYYINKYYFIMIYIIYLNKEFTIYCIVNNIYYSYLYYISIPYILHITIYKYILLRKIYISESYLLDK